MNVIVVDGHSGRRNVSDVHGDMRAVGHSGGKPHGQQSAMGHNTRPNRRCASRSSRRAFLAPNDISQRKFVSITIVRWARCCEGREVVRGEQILIMIGDGGGVQLGNNGEI